MVARSLTAVEVDVDDDLVNMVHVDSAAGQVQVAWLRLIGRREIPAGTLPSPVPASTPPPRSSMNLALSVGWSCFLVGRHSSRLTRPSMPHRTFTWLLPRADMMSSLGFMLAKTTTGIT